MNSNEENTLNSLDDRIDNLEFRIAKEERSKIKRFGAIGGVIALLISILIGGLNIADRVYYAQVKERNNNLAEMRNIVDRFTDINLKIIEVELQNNPVKTQVIYRNFSTIKQSLIERANTLISSLNYDVGFAALMSIAYENLNAGFIERSIVLSEKALKISASESLDSNIAMRSEATRFIARSTAMPSQKQNIAKARKYFREAINLVTAEPGLNISSMAQVTYQDWFFGELYFGDCDRAQKIYEEAVPFISSLSSEALFIETFRQQVKITVANQKRCKLVY